MKSFEGHDDISRRQLNIYLLSKKEIIRDYVVLYNNAKQQREDEINQWRHMARNVRGDRPRRLEDIDRWIQDYVKYLDLPESSGCTKEVYDIAMGVEEEYLSYRSIWSFGRHFRRHGVDVNLKTCDSGIATRVNTLNGPIDHVGVIEDIMEVTIGGSKDIVLKVNWYEDNINATPTLFFSVDTTKKQLSHRIATQPFVYSSDVEQVFFAVDEAESHRSFVLQSQIMKHTVFNYHGLLSLNDGSHVPGLMAGPEQETIPSNYEDNEPQRYSNDESSSARDWDDEADHTNDVQNVTLTSDEDSQIGSQQLKYKFVFIFISYISTTFVDFTIINNISHI